jgi:hypothetical protein
MTKRILFHDNFLSKRGTSIALFDYAYYNQEILGNESIIISHDQKNDEDAEEKFNKYFDVINYKDFEYLPTIVERHNIDYFYYIKSGENDGRIVPGVKNLIHSVFCGRADQKHGDKYAVVSEWLSSISNYEIPYVPHMINMPEIDSDLRSELSISKNSVVLGRYGGLETFDIRFVYSSIAKALEKRNDIYFIFMNTNKFIDHPRAIFLNGSCDMEYKSKFINTCDAMLHARIQGESFGLSVLEFACKNKQIITYGNSSENNHLLYLDGNCAIYNSENELYEILLNISKRNPYDTLYLNEKFSPSNVINKFNEVFLK